jgi:hypothetical protein
LAQQGSYPGGTEDAEGNWDREVFYDQVRFGPHSPLVIEHLEAAHRVAKIDHIPFLAPPIRQGFSLQQLPTNCLPATFSAVAQVALAALARPDGRNARHFKRLDRGPGNRRDRRRWRAGNVERTLADRHLPTSPGAAIPSPAAGRVGRRRHHSDGCCHYRKRHLAHCFLP